MGRKAVDPSKLMAFVDNPTPPPRNSHSHSHSHPSSSTHSPSRGFGASGARLSSTQGAAFAAHMTPALAGADLPEIHPEIKGADGAKRKNRG